jgi:tRNA (guanosine-2'-O-)-methyltransferase
VHIVQQSERFRTSSKVTQGCDKWLEVREHASTEECLQRLKQRGFRLYAAVPGAQKALEELDPLEPAAFLLGNEHAGLSAVAKSGCDAEFAIPLYGFSESLNLSVATALIVYTHCTRRRQALGAVSDLDEAQLTELRARYYARDVRSAAAIVRHHLQSGG